MPFFSIIFDCFFFSRIKNSLPLCSCSASVKTVSHCCLFVAKWYQEYIKSSPCCLSKVFMGPEGCVDGLKERFAMMSGYLSMSGCLRILLKWWL